MIIKSEIIQLNIERVEQAKKDFSILSDYCKYDDHNILKQLWDEAKSYGLHSYVNFLDFERYAIKSGQQLFYKNKIKIPEFREVLIKNASDETVRKILKSKGKVSFAKFINSPKWELFSGNRRRRGGVRYNDNFVMSAPIIANFCIQNEIDVMDHYRISDYYRSPLAEIDISLKKELVLTYELINFMVEKLQNSPHDFKRLNVEHASKFLTEELKKKLVNIERGESVKLIENTDYYGGLTFGKVYEVLDKEIVSGRLQVQITNDLGTRRHYPYRLFETVSNLREDALLQILGDL